MRKILSGFLATSMIVAVASSVTFAETVSQAVAISDISWKTNATIGTPNFDADDKFTGVSDKYTETINLGAIHLVATYNNVEITVQDISNSLKASTEGTFTLTDGTPGASPTNASVTANAPTKDATITKKDIAAAIAKGAKSFSTRIGGNLYTFSLDLDSAGNLVLNSNASTMPEGVEIAISYPNATAAVTPEEVVSTEDDTHKVAVSVADPSIADAGGLNTVAGGKEYADLDRSGDALESLSVSDVVLCDGSGNPIVLTEHKTGVDEDQNSENGVQSGTTIYFMLRDGNDAPVPKLNDDTYWKLKVTKGDNAKHIKAITDVEKTFTNGLYKLDDTSSAIDATKGRHRYIKVELNEIYTDDEYKITLDLRLSPKTKAVDAKLLVKQPTGGTVQVSDDDEIKVKDFYFYMKNIVKDADNDWEVGVGGLMLNPLENDWNDVTYYDEDGDLAHVKFFADSNVDKFYAKLSTKWEHADYASYFNDQDAFIFNFTGSPKLSSTSRADLEIYNPFVDEDGNETIDPSTAVVYQVIDGDLYDVTDSFTYEEGDNGDMAFTTRTRFLGTYIICEKAVEEAVSDETVPDELTPDTTPEAPEDTTPANTGGGKAPANTGKYL